MEPLNDQELDDVLRQWQAHPAPESIKRKTTQAQRQRWWQWLLTGSIRIPVPVAIAFAAALLAAWITSIHPVRHHERSEFQPVKRLEPHIIKSSYEDNN